MGIILTKDKIYQDEISILNFYAPNAKASTFIKEILVKLKTHIALHTIIDSNNPLSSMGRFWKQNLNRHTIKVTEIMKQMDLVDVYRTLYPKPKGYPFFSAPHDAFSKIDQTLSHKTCLNRYKIIEIISCLLSDQHILRLIFNNNINNWKPTYMWNVYNNLVSDKTVKEEI